MPGTVLEAPVAEPIPQSDDHVSLGGDPLDSAPRWTVGRLVTGLLVCGPLLGFALLLPLGRAAGFNFWDVVIGTALYFFTGFGIATGFHRLFTHRSFKTNRILKVLFAVAGSMALEGGVIGWVAVHRRHHMYGDQPGDPHSPYKYGSGVFAILRGFVHAQVGWLFSNDPTDTRRFAPDLHRDGDLVIVDRLFPLLAVVSLAIPFGIGLSLYGTLAGALAVFLWAGLVRMALLHHVTWSINSACHLWGRRPFPTKDRSTNLALLALPSFGESWHNFHHAAPSSARHGVLRHQLDPSARLIRLLEHLGLATKVRWPTPAQISALSKGGE